jgi:peptidyl-prolyl cis-trans isomerase SurA
MKRTSRVCTQGVLLVTLLAGLAASPLPSRAEAAKSEVIERTVAVVNGDPLLLSELRSRAAPFLARLMRAPETQRMQLMQQLYGELLTQLIDERLLEQDARKLNITITAADIDRAVENVARQSGLKEPEFWDAVATQGFTRDQYRTDVRRQLLRLKVINQKVRARINVTEDDVRRKYDNALRVARKSASFRVAHVFLSADTESVTNLAQVRGEADALRKKLTVDNFPDAMTEHGGGELGWVSQGDLPAALADALLGLEPGTISEPVRGPAGLHIFLLRERKEGESSMGSYEQVKGDLYRQMVDEAMGKQEATYLGELRKRSLITRRL